MQSSSQGPYGYRGYQGYPYRNPMVTDAPSIDAETAARWANLPRRPVHRNGPSGVTPETSGGVNRPQAPQRPQTPTDTVPPKKDIDDNPVVYIDVPKPGSQVSQSIVTPEDEEPEFVQDTIMYDPFENRRIDMPKEESTSAASSESGSAYTPQYPSTRPIPTRPDTLNLAGAGSSSPSPASSSRQGSSLPSFMSKESQVYLGDGSDGFPLSPIPISEFPEPPPAYTEVDLRPPPREPVREPPIVESPPPPPRTQVIVNDPASTPVPVMGLANYDRKNLICHHCGSRVHTLVVKEVGMITHLIACFVLFIFLPLIIIIYFTDFFKYKNHYCPNCSKLIGYETPIVGQRVNYVT